MHYILTINRYKTILSNITQMHSKITLLRDTGHNPYSCDRLKFSDYRPMSLMLNNGNAPDWLILAIITLSGFLSIDLNHGLVSFNAKLVRIR